MELPAQDPMVSLEAMLPNWMEVKATGRTKGLRDAGLTEVSRTNDIKLNVFFPNTAPLPTHMAWRRGISRGQAPEMGDTSLVQSSFSPAPRLGVPDTSKRQIPAQTDQLGPGRGAGDICGATACTCRG